MKKRIIITLVILLCGAGFYWVYNNVLMHQSQPSGIVDSSRPSHWALPMNRPGLRNLYKVSDNLYRGAQPETEGIQELEKLGVKTIVSLELFHSDKTKLEESGSRIGYEHIYMQTWKPTTDNVVRFLTIVSDTNRTPVFVHCYHGSDRTGTMCALYRIIIEDWTKEEAIREMKEGGYGFHSVWSNLIDFINNLDVNEMRKTIKAKI